MGLMIKAVASLALVSHLFMMKVLLLTITVLCDQGSLHIVGFILSPNTQGLSHGSFLEFPISYA